MILTLPMNSKTRHATNRMAAVDRFSVKISPVVTKIGTTMGRRICLKLCSLS